MPYFICLLRFLFLSKNLLLDFLAWCARFGFPLFPARRAVIAADNLSRDAWDIGFLVKAESVSLAARPAADSFRWRPEARWALEGAVIDKSLAALADEAAVAPA